MRRNSGASEQRGVPFSGDGADGAMVVVKRRFNDTDIGQRIDGYLNATAMCRAAGRRLDHYWASPETAAFVEKLAETTRISVSLLVVVKEGRNGGTWIHPQIAYHLAQWCSPAFAVQVTEWIHEINTKGYATAPGVELGELARRTDGISRMVARKVTAIERALPGLLDAVDAVGPLADGVAEVRSSLTGLGQAVGNLTGIVHGLIQRFDGLLVTHDPRRSAVDSVSVFELLNQHGALPKGRRSLNARVGNRLRAMVAANVGYAAHRCPVSGSWLFPRALASQFMATAGIAMVRAHNDSVTGQGQLPLSRRRRGKLRRGGGGGAA